MRKMLLTAVMCLVSAPAMAGTNLFNYGEFFKSMRAGYSVNQHGQSSEILYTALQTFHSKDGIDFLALNIGYEAAMKRPAVTMGVRVDNILPLLWRGEWGRAHVTTAKLPTIEFGPYASFWPKSSSDLWKLDTYYGLNLAVGF